MLIGDNLERIIAETYGKITCSPCRKRVKRLNTMTVEEALSSIDETAEDVYNSRRKIKSRLLRIMSDTLPKSMVLEIVKNHIRQAIQEHKEWLTSQSGQ